MSRIDSCVWSAAELVLIDFDMGATAVRNLTRRITADPGHACAVVFDVDESSSATVADLIEAGASAYVPSETPLADLILIGVMASAGQACCSPRVAFEVFGRVSKLSNQHFASERIRSAQLTKREVEILQLLALNCDNQRIADNLFVSVATVKNHIHRLLSKLHARNRVEAVAWWQTRKRNAVA